MHSERVRFPGAFGDRLAARLERPAGEPRAWALFAHCFTCSKDYKAVRRISEGLVEMGIAVLRFDFTGLGESEGDFADTNFSSNLDDLVAAADFLRAEHAAPELLLGHSLGGAAVLAAAHRIPESRAVATLAAPSDTVHLIESLGEVVDEVQEEGEAEVEIAGRHFRIRRQLLEDLERQHLAERIGKLERALLVFHSPVDQTVGIGHARRIFEAAKHPKSFVSLDGADHLLARDPADARFVARVLAAWADRYVCSPRQEEAGEERGDVSVVGGAAGYTTQVRAGRHRLWADEPERVGGADRGPDPHAYLLAALGACTSITLRMYADRKEWPLERVRVDLDHGRIHAEDCAECETREGRVERIVCRIRVEGALDEKQRQRLLEIARRCPVHRTLTSEIRIESTIE